MLWFNIFLNSSSFEPLASVVSAVSEPVIVASVSVWFADFVSSTGFVVSSAEFYSCVETSTLVACVALLETGTTFWTSGCLFISETL